MEFFAQTSDLLLLIAKALVDDPNAVTVTVRSDLRPPSFEVRVAPNDLGKLIGRQGRTARSIRTIMAASAQRYRQPPVSVDIAATKEMQWIDQVQAIDM